MMMALGSEGSPRKVEGSIVEVGACAVGASVAVEPSSVVTTVSLGPLEVVSGASVELGAPPRTVEATIGNERDGPPPRVEVGAGIVVVIPLSVVVTPIVLSVPRVVVGSLPLLVVVLAFGSVGVFCSAPSTGRRRTAPVT